MNVGNPLVFDKVSWLKNNNPDKNGNAKTDMNATDMNATGENTIGENTIGENTTGENTTGENTTGEHTTDQNDTDTQAEDAARRKEEKELEERRLKEQVTSWLRSHLSEITKRDELGDLTRDNGSTLESSSSDVTQDVIAPPDFIASEALSVELMDVLIQSWSQIAQSDSALKTFHDKQSATPTVSPGQSPEQSPEQAISISSQSISSTVNFVEDILTNCCQLDLVHSLLSDSPANAMIDAAYTGLISRGNLCNKSMSAIQKELQEFEKVDGLGTKASTTNTTKSSSASTSNTTTPLPQFPPNCLDTYLKNHWQRGGLRLNANQQHDLRDSYLKLGAGLLPVEDHVPLLVKELLSKFPSTSPFISLMEKRGMILRRLRPALAELRSANFPLLRGNVFLYYTHGCFYY